MNGRVEPIYESKARLRDFLKTPCGCLCNTICVRVGVALHLKTFSSSGHLSINLRILFQLTPVGETIFKDIKAIDADAGVNGLVDYFVVPGNSQDLGSTNGVGKDRVSVADGYGFFAINSPHQGQVIVNRSIDYERTQRYLVTIVASVSIAW